MPIFAKANKMEFPAKDPALNLTTLEERLIAPRIPFMVLQEHPRGGQFSIHGNFVNVPMDVTETMVSLPRNIDESQTIPSKLKCKLCYKKHYQFQNIRPASVLKAAKYLVETSKLFKKEGIRLSAESVVSNDLEGEGILGNNTEKDESISSWLKDICDSGPLHSDDKVSEDTSGSIIDIDKPPNDSSSHMDQDEQNDNGSQNNLHSKQENHWVETTGTDNPPTEVMETLLIDMSFMNPGNIMTIAPGEGNKPKGIFEDTDSEFLSFLTIYCDKR